MSKKRPPRDCRSFEITLSEWIFDGTVEEKRLAPLKGHLKTCPSCKDLKTDFQKLKEDLTSGDPAPAPKNLKENILNELKPKSSGLRLQKILLVLVFLIIIGTLTAVLTLVLKDPSFSLENFDLNTFIKIFTEKLNSLIEKVKQLISNTALK